MALFAMLTSMISVLYAFLAIAGLGFLVFIHELGHYIIAKREGMKIEAFSIGFGKAIYSWERDGVQWKLCWLPFGGYVKIAGMQKEGSREPYEIHDGFYGKSPWQRIKVALAGPFVNIAFALVAFTALWLMGGRVKPFADFTHRIGWVDPNSPLYAKGVRPGDVIQSYDNHPFQNFRDLLIASVMTKKEASIQGYRIDYETGAHSEFSYQLPTYVDPRSGKDTLYTIGVVSPARYLLFEGSLPPGSPMINSGLQEKDRLLWANGELLFSMQQLSSLVNERAVFLTVQRGKDVFHTKVPRILLDELQLSAAQKGEIDDWRHASHLAQGRLQDVYYIPYVLSDENLVLERIDFVDDQEQTHAFEHCERCAYFHPLIEGDRIVSVAGKRVETSADLLKELQTPQVLLIVERGKELFAPTSSQNAEDQFEQISFSDLSAMISSIGTENLMANVGDLHLLKSVVPKIFTDFDLSVEQRAMLAQEIAQTKKEIEEIKDLKRRDIALHALEQSHSTLLLGCPLKDRDVTFNPTPIAQFNFVVKDTWRTLSALGNGTLSPKYMSGPIGIVHAVHQSWMMGGKDALFWMGVISLNLGLVNLLPIPVLDGGHICFALFESVTKRRLRAKTMERLIIPFVGLLIAFFLFITYQDIQRLFSVFF